MGLVRRDTALEKIGQAFGNIGWDKKFSDLSQEDAIGLVVVLKSIEGLEDEFAGDYLTELYFKYGGGRVGLRPEDIPF